MIKAVVLDVDDTLSLTESTTFLLENETLRLMGRPPMPRDIHLQTWGQSLEEALPVRAPGADYGQFAKIQHRLVAEWSAAGKLESIAPENYEVLDQLIAQGKQLAVITTRNYGEARHLLEPGHALSGRVKLFYHYEKTKYHKPDPRVFNELLTDNNLQPEECIYVGDAVSDMTAANDAGLHFIACLESGLRTREDFAAGHIDAFIDRFADLTSAIAKLEARI